VGAMTLTGCSSHSASTSTTTALPHPRSQAIASLVFPPGSTLEPSDIPSLPGEQPFAETWIVPLPLADEIADLRAQLPIGLPFDDTGKNPWCGEHPNPLPGSVNWAWGVPQTFPLAEFVEVSAQAAGVKTTQVFIDTHSMNPYPGCPR
jgi:hypothetical protein